jgi:hypothetical protein
MGASHHRTAVAILGFFCIRLVDVLFVFHFFLAEVPIDIVASNLFIGPFIVMKFE